MNRCAQVTVIILVVNTLTLFLFNRTQHYYNYAETHAGGMPVIGLPTSAQQQPQQLQQQLTESPGRRLSRSDLFIVPPPKPYQLNASAFASPVARFLRANEQRKTAVDLHCAQLKKRPREPFSNDPAKLFVLQDRKLTWCPIFKAGSSTWLSLIFDLSTKPESQKKAVLRKNPGNYLQIGRSVAPTLSRASFAKYNQGLKAKNVTGMSFIVVRHPFERLVSAYRDKLERIHGRNGNIAKDFYYKRYGKSIVNKYRKRALQKFGDKFFSKQNNYGTPLPVGKNLRPSADLPTFWEFVQYVIDSRKTAMDEHWRPMHSYCSLCILKYDYVIKFEDLIEESKTFLNVTGMASSLPVTAFDRWLNPNRPGSMNSSAITAKYFDMLSDEEVKKVYNVYQDDFKLFGYDFSIRSITLPMQ